MKNKGITLVEILVSIAIGIVVLTTILALLFKGLSVWNNSSKATEAQSSTLLAVNFLVRELSISSGESVTIIPDSASGIMLSAGETPKNDWPGISFLSPRDENGVPVFDPVKAAITWQKFHIIYLNKENNVLYLANTLYLYSPSSHPFLLEDAAAKNIKLIHKPSGIEALNPWEVHPATDKVIARNIANFTLQADAKLVSITEIKADKNGNSSTISTKIPFKFAQGR